MTRAQFLKFGFKFQVITLVIALLAALLPHPERVLPIQWSLVDFGWGVLGVVPMLVLYAFVRDLRDIVIAILGDVLNQCHWYDLLLLALLAGLSEEMLFRGVLESWISLWEMWGAVVIVSLLFGAVHALSLKYFLFATLTGLYMSWLTTGFGLLPSLFSEPNLVRPIVTHAVYDFIAFLLIRREFRQRLLQDPGP